MVLICRRRKEIRVEKPLSDEICNFISDIQMKETIYSFNLSNVHVSSLRRRLQEDNQVWNRVGAQQAGTGRHGKAPCSCLSTKPQRVSAVPVTCEWLELEVGFISGCPNSMILIDLAFHTADKLLRAEHRGLESKCGLRQPPIWCLRRNDDDDDVQIINDDRIKT